jgi:hypothetical protein
MWIFLSTQQDGCQPSEKMQYYAGMATLDNKVRHHNALIGIFFLTETVHFLKRWNLAGPQNVPMDGV